MLLVDLNHLGNTGVDVQPLNPPFGVNKTGALGSISAGAGKIHVLTNLPFKYKSKYGCLNLQLNLPIFVVIINCASRWFRWSRSNIWGQSARTKGPCYLHQVLIVRYYI